MYDAYGVIDREGDSKGYETSASSYVNGLPGPMLHKPSAATIIPNSPRRCAGGTLESNGVEMDTSDSEIYAPRAESPELASTPPFYPRQVADAAPSSGQINGGSPAPEAHLDTALAVSMPLPVSFSKPEDYPANLGEHDMALSGGVLLEAMPPSSPKIAPPPPRVAPLPSTRSNSSLREFAGSSFLTSTPDDSFDPISTDTENLRSKSWLSSFKRLKTKNKRLPPSPQVVSTQPKDSAGVAEGFIHSRSSEQEAEHPISLGSAANTKRNSKELQYLPQAVSVQFVDVTVNEYTAKLIPQEKKAQLQVRSESGGTLIQKLSQPSPAEPVAMKKSTVNPIPLETKAERHVLSEFSGSITKELPQPSPEEHVTVNKVTLKPTPPEKKAEPCVPSEFCESITKEPPRLSPKVGYSHPRNLVNRIEETVVLKSSGKEVEAGSPLASTSSTKAKRKRSQPLPQAELPRSQKVASSAEGAVKLKPSDTKVGSVIPLGFIGSTAVNISQRQPSPQASSARTKESMPVADAAVQPTASKEMQDAASAESSKDKEIKLKANGTKRTTKKPNGAAAGEKFLSDRKAEKSVRKSANTPKLAKDEEPNLKVVIQPEEKVEEVRIADTRPETDTLHENASAKEYEFVNLTAISLPQSSLRRSKSSQPIRKRNGPGSDPPGDISRDSGASSTRQKEPDHTQKSSKLVVPNDITEEIPQDESRLISINSTTKYNKAPVGAGDTRVLSEPSSPRGPAQYMSRPISAGSFSSVSSSGSDSNSQDDMVLLPEAVAPAMIKSEQGIKSLRHCVSNSRALANTEGSFGKGPVSKTGHSPISISSSNYNSSEDTGSESHAEEVEIHLPLKPRRDPEPSILIPDSPPRGRPRRKKQTSLAPVSRPLDYSVKSGPILNQKSTPIPNTANPQGERPSSSAPGASRPTNSRYPSMADLIKKPRPTEQSRPGKISPSKSAANAGATSAFPFHSFSGSSSSETSSSEE